MWSWCIPSTHIHTCFSFGWHGQHVHYVASCLLTRLVASAISTLGDMYEWLGLGREVPASVQAVAHRCGLGSTLAAARRAHARASGAGQQQRFRERRLAQKGNSKSQSKQPALPDAWKSSAAGRVLLKAHLLQAAQIWTTPVNEIVQDPLAPKHEDARYSLCAANRSVSSPTHNKTLDDVTLARLKHRCRRVVKAYGFRVGRFF
jgi:hypothetical protein